MDQENRPVRASATERRKAADARLKAAGGRLISLRLTKEQAERLEIMRKFWKRTSDAETIIYALFFFL